MPFRPSTDHGRLLGLASRHSTKRILLEEQANESSGSRYGIGLSVRALFVGYEGEISQHDLYT